jgi:hypothetical protein
LAVTLTSEPVTDALSRTTSVRLRPRAVSPRLARKLVRDLATGSTLPTHVIDDASFIVGELVTTSIREVHRPARLSIELDNDHVTVRIHDDGGKAVTAAHSNDGSTRRWEVVRRLASSWGYTRDGDHRELWATVRAGVTT